MSNQVIFLSSGYGLPIPALTLGCDLERRGWRLQADGQTLRITRTTTPSGVEALDIYDPDIDPDKADTLTDSDRESISRWKWHLLAVLSMNVDHNI